MTTVVGRSIVLALLALCLPLAAVGGAVAPPSDGGTVADSEPTLESAAFQQNTTDDGSEVNETSRHRNPEEYGEDGDQEAMERWLSSRLSDQLESGAIELDEGEYGFAREHVDEEYRETLGQYVEVAGDTGDDEQAESFETAQREQERLAEAASEYNETRAAYEEAREDGDQERARELGRELEALADEVENSSRHLEEEYDNISEDSDFDSDSNLTEARNAIQTVNREVQENQSEVRDAEFTETTMTLESTTEEISFTDPLVGRGELRTADGDPVENREIRLEIGNQTIRSETNATGSFDVEYRPVSVPLSADSVSVRYVPDNQSTHLGSETSVPVSIEQVEPTLTVSSVDPETVAYGDAVTVDSEVVVDDVPADDAPLAVSIGGTPLGHLESNETTLNGSETVPLDVPAGEQELVVGLPFEDRALASASAETTITVATTEPDLTVSANRTADREVAVNGSLEVAGDAVDGQSVQLVADGTSLETTTTDENGAFAETVSLPEDVAAGDVQLVAVHDDDGTNLARTEAATTVSFPSASSSLLPAEAWLALGVLAVAGGGAGLYWYRDDTESAPEPVTRADADDSTPTPESTGPSVSRILLSEATDQLSRGDSDGAVRSCYAAVRQTLGSRVGVTDSLTHWEFYRQYRTRESVSEGADGLLQDVIEGYEQAAFRREGVSADEAETILERARQLCDVEGSTRNASADD